MATPNLQAGRPHPIIPHHRLPAGVWLDAENLFRELDRQRRCATPRQFVKAVLAAASKVVQVGPIFAYGDFRMLARVLGCNVERELRRWDIHTVHLSHRHGKNGADMQIACDILENLFDDSAPRSIVIGTGDRDFCPVVQAARRRGVAVFILTFSESLSGELATMADQVILLEPHLPHWS